MSETVYKELYEANKKLEFMQNTIMAIADRLSVATGIDIKEASLSAKQVYKGSSPFGFSKLFYSLSIKIITMPCYKYSSFRYRRVFLDRAFLQSYTL